MSNTRRAPEDSPFRQERYASSEAYKTSLNALLVAKRCTVLQDPELVELLWFIQDRSLPNPFCTGGRVGSVEAIARELLREANWQPVVHEWVEDWSEPGTKLPARAEGKSQFQLVAERTELAAGHLSKRSELATALRALALDPSSPPAELPGLGAAWRRVLRQCSTKCRDEIRRALAPTSIAKRTAEALRFAREIKKIALITGCSDLGKSAAAKAFCAASGGTARYILTPPRGDMDSLFREVAAAIGVADSLSRKASDVCALVESTLKLSRLMLVFDEAHNLFSGLARVTRQPERIMWVRRLYDLHVPMAFIALPEFDTRISRYAEQLDWESWQIKKLFCCEEKLPALTKEDFEILVARIGPELSDESKTLIASSASGQHGAQYVVDTVAVARHFAAKEKRAVPSDDDVRQAIGLRPQFVKPQPARKGRAKQSAGPAAGQTELGFTRGASRTQNVCIPAAEPLHAAPRG